jgi:hypothetical protein
VRNLSTNEEKKTAMPAVLDAHAGSLSVVNNRIFIAREVRQHKMLDKWKKAMEEFDGHHDPAKFGTLLGELAALIEVEAKAEISNSKELLEPPANSPSRDYLRCVCGLL